MKSLLVLCLLVGSLWGIPIEDDDQRVLEGRKAKKNELPFIVSLQEWTDGKCYPFCGAVIIQSKWILTAAHCFDDTDRLIGNLRLHAGNNLACQYASTSQVNQVDEVYIHPEYDAYLLINDIALIKARSPFDFKSGQVQPISLPTGKEDLPDYGTIAGWGATNPEETEYPAHLMVADKMPVSKAQACHDEFDDYDPTSMICIGANHPKNACSGDSGGPFVQISKTSKKPLVVGVTSYGTTPCDNRPIVYTLVAKHLPWIKDTIKKHN